MVHEMVACQLRQFKCRAAAASSIGIGVTSSFSSRGSSLDMVTDNAGPCLSATKSASPIQHEILWMNRQPR